MGLFCKMQGTMASVFLMHVGGPDRSVVGWGRSALRHRVQGFSASESYYVSSVR